MTLLTARSQLTRERMDWNRSHLPWLPPSLYRLAREVVGARQ